MIATKFKESSFLPRRTRRARRGLKMNIEHEQGIKRIPGETSKAGCMKNPTSTWYVNAGVCRKTVRLAQISRV
jgi:hypothetical protein